MIYTAQILADSLNPAGGRLTTFLLRYPRFIHSEVLTHRVFARNASSSRAMPIAKLIRELQDTPAMPAKWGRNQSGMQARHDLSPDQAEIAKGYWLAARDAVVAQASKMLVMAEQPHKQIVNRMLEPWAHISVVLTGTDFANWFALRCHEDADPTMKALADAMWDAYFSSVPVELVNGQWHLPFIRVEDRVAARSLANGTEEEITRTLLKISVARCARTSYDNHHRIRSTVEDDVRLHDRLLLSVPGHFSPAEHQATPDTGSVQMLGGKLIRTYDNPQLHGPLRGFVQYRKTLAGENITHYEREAA